MNIINNQLLKRKRFNLILFILNIIFLKLVRHQSESFLQFKKNMTPKNQHLNLRHVTLILSYKLVPLV